jgi:hypothetical protein
MRRMGNQFVGKQLLGFVREIPGVSVAKAVNLSLDRFADRGMTVAQAADRRSPRCVEISLPAGVV